MKELSIEEKAKRYDEAIEKFDVILNLNTVKKSGTIFADDVRKILPELKESEDEKVRKALIKLVKKTGEGYENVIDGVSIENAISWLEKQGEHAKFRDSIQVGDKVTRNEDGVLVNLSQLKRVAKPADKVEPKFHEGEWITNGDYTWKIVEVKPLDYILQSQDGNIVDDTISHVDEQFHSFTIEDAKDGDVLATDDGLAFIYNGYLEEQQWPFAYGGINIYGRFGICDGLLPFTHQKVVPATKEQREQLEKAMTDAGYQWDADKKELRKVKEDLTEFENALANKSTKRSDEDEKYLNIVYSVINQPSAQGIYDYHNVDKTDVINWLKNRVYPKQEWSKDDITRINEIIETLNIVQANRVRTQRMHYNKATIDKNIDWLKSLKDRYTWKPSKIQLETLKELSHDFPTKRGTIEEILKHLKQL